MSRKPRHLSPEEKALWDKVASTTTRRERDGVQILKPIAPTPVRIEDPAPLALKPVERLKSQQTTSYDLSPVLSEQIAAAPVNMDTKAFRRLKRGKLSPDGRIDLHGMTLDQAYGRLIPFVQRSYASGKRLLLIITGKGKTPNDTGPIPVRRGALRHAVPGWLKSPALASMVLQVTEAHQKHGGGGAYYVYLRRVR